MVIVYSHLFQLLVHYDLSFQHGSNKNIRCFYNFLVLLIFQYFKIDQRNILLFSFRVELRKISNPPKGQYSIVQNLIQFSFDRLKNILESISHILSMQNKHTQSDMSPFIITLDEGLFLVASLNYLSYFLLKDVDLLSLLFCIVG